VIKTADYIITLARRWDGAVRWVADWYARAGGRGEKLYWVYLKQMRWPNARCG